MPVLEQIEAKLKEINVTLTIYNIESAIERLNDYRWRWSFTSLDKLAPKIEEFIDGLDWWHLDALNFKSKCYWAGFLTAEPWFHTGEAEQTMLNDLTHNHMKVVYEDGGIVIRFKENEDSICHPIFRDHWEEWDGNIAPSFNAVMRRMEDYVKEFLEGQIPEGSQMQNRFGQWEQSVYCDTCDAFTYAGPGDYKCPQCNQEYPTSDGGE